MEKDKEINTLVFRIEHHREMYYDGIPEISDEEYDKLENRLKELDPDNPILKKVGSELKQSTFSKVKHKKLMLSLDKCYKDEELSFWLSTRTARNHEGYITMPKLDGFAVSLKYKRLISQKGLNLIKAVSRGDGEIGEDITENVRQCIGVPDFVYLDYSEGEITDLEVRGEIVLLKKDFEELGLANKGFKNCRNTAAGTIRNKDPNVVKERRLIFIAYSTVENGDIDTHSCILDFLKSKSFTTVPYKVVVHEKDLLDSWRTMENARNKFPYDIDGMVVGINNLMIQKSQGSTSHHPKGLVACKFESGSSETAIRDIEWQVSRTGLINPVGVFDPIEIDGAIISKATLHNVSEIERLGIKYSETIIKVARQGGIIPKIVEKIRDYGKGKKFIIPETCPICKENTEIRESVDGVKTLHCTNVFCPAVNLYRILHYISCMGIDSIGEETLHKMMDTEMVMEIIDLYKLRSEDLQKLDKVGKKLADKIVNNIKEASESSDLGKFIWALGIPNIGKSMAKKLVSRYPTVSDFLRCSESELIAMEGIDNKTASAIVSFINTDKSNKFILEVTNGNEVHHPFVLFGKVVENSNEMPKENIASLINGKSFIVTGTLSVSRKSIEETIINNGGTIKSSVSKNLDYLICGKNAGSKLDKANKLGITVLTEEDFNSLLLINSNKKSNGNDFDRFPVNENGELEQLNMFDSDSKETTDNSKSNPSSDLDEDVWGD